MKMQNYLKSLVAPLSMLMVFACTPDQYHQKGEYDDVYFTRNDRKQQPEIVPNVTADPAVVTQNRSQAAIPAELQEKYTNQADVVYYEAQGPRVKSAEDLNYDDFVYDYNNEQLAYYELPLDWDTEWSRDSFNDLMANDYQFKLAWYDQYYQGKSYRMDAYLDQQSNVNRARNSFYGNNAGGGTAIPVYSNLMVGNVMYGTMMPMTPMNMAFYDPFWNNRFSVNIGLGWSNFGWGGGWMNPWYDPFFIGFNRWNRPWGPVWGGGFGGGNTIIVNNGDLNTNRPNVTRSGRLQSTLVTSVAADSQNGARIRTRSQRAAMVGESGASSAAVVRSSRAGLTRQSVSAGRTAGRTIARSSLTRTDLTAGRVNRISTDQSRVRTSSTGSRLTRSRVDASRISSGRSSAGITRTSGRASSFTRADVSRSSRSGSYSRSSALSFNRNSSSSITRSVANRNNTYQSYSNSRSYQRSSSSRSVSGYPSRSSGSSYNRSSSSRSSGVSRSSGSSSRSSGVSRSSGSSSRSSGSSGGSRSGGSSRSGRN